jgi:imidazoleglycerol-phosphate dehydratase
MRVALSTTCEAGAMIDTTRESSVHPRAPRRADRHRVTKESDVAVELDLDGSGRFEVETGLPFFDHMLEQLARHSSIDLTLRTSGDLEVDAHHSVEDTGLTIGEAFAVALGDKVGIRRFASIRLPLDEALVDVAIDLSGRPFLHYDVPFAPEAQPLGAPGFDPQLAEEFFRAFFTNAGITAHVNLCYGKNAHHIVEATFKGVARALRDAVRIENDRLPSTKGVL